MAQEAFLRAYRSLRQWRGEAAFSTWLFALATHLYCSEIRRMPPISISVDDIREPPDLHTGDFGLEEEERGRIVRRAVLSLPAKYREAMILVYFHDMDISAAARSLGLPEGTVKARLSRGRQILRGKLSGRVFAPLVGKEAS